MSPISPSDPTGLFCANSRMSVGVIAALAGRREQVALVGFDDFELADALTMPLTVVRADAAELGQTAAEGRAAAVHGRLGRTAAEDRAADGAAGA